MPLILGTGAQAEQTLAGQGSEMRTPLTAAPHSAECDLLEHRRHLWLPVGRTFTPALLLVSAVLALRTFYCPLVFIINEKGPE